MMNWTRKEPRQNKANFRTDGNGRGPARLPAAPAGPVVLKKPIGPGLTGRGAGCRCPLGPVVQTKPIGRHGRRWARAGEVTSGAVARAHCAKQTQSALDRSEEMPAGRAAIAAAAGAIAPDKTPASKVPESDSDPRFWADIKDQSGWSRLLAGASNKANSARAMGRTSAVCRRVITNWTCRGPGQDKADSPGRADAMDVESAPVCRPHPGASQNQISLSLGSE